MKKIALLFFITIAIACSTKAQVYNNAIGVRLTPNSAYVTMGVTAKHFLNEKTAIEGLIGVNDGFSVGGLYELYFPIEAVKNLQWFAGAGAYMAIRSKSFYSGGTVITGADYKFEEIPLNISLDWKPEINLIGGVRFEASGVGISARFTF